MAVLVMWLTWCELLQLFVRLNSAFSVRKQNEQLLLL